MPEDSKSSDLDDADSGCGSDCCGCHGSCAGESVDIDALGKEAVEIADLFKEVDDHLVSALSLRKKILETLDARTKESEEMKAKMEKVLGAQHPVLLQFVFGSE